MRLDPKRSIKGRNRSGYRSLSVSTGRTPLSGNPSLDPAGLLWSRGMAVSFHGRQTTLETISNEELLLCFNVVELAQQLCLRNLHLKLHLRLSLHIRKWRKLPSRLYSKAEATISTAIQSKKVLDVRLAEHVPVRRGRQCCGLPPNKFRADGFCDFGDKVQQAPTYPAGLWPRAEKRWLCGQKINAQAVAPCSA